jgi:hypothetical protein
MLVQRGGVEEMRKMRWDEELWRKLKDAISPMPPFVRQQALVIIVEASEAFARERGSEVVEEEDLVKAAKTKTPPFARKQMLESLAEMGINVKPEETSEL